MPLIFSSHQSADGLMPTWAFEKWIKEKLEQISKEMGSDSTDFDKICAIKYEQRHAHQDPEAWRQDSYHTIAKAFGINLEEVPK